MQQCDCFGLQVRCKVFAPSAAEVIYHPHSCIALDERIHERGPDERGASRNQRPRILPIHLWLLCRFVIEPPAHKNNLGLRGSVANLCFCRRSRRDKASCSRIERGTDFFDQKASRRRIALLPALTKYEPRCSSRKSEQRSETNQSYRPGEQFLCGEFAELFCSVVEFALHLVKPSFEKESFAACGGCAELRDELVQLRNVSLRHGRGSPRTVVRDRD